MYVSSDEDLLVLAALLADKNKFWIYLVLFTVTKIGLSYIRPIRLHCRDANTSFQEEKAKDP
jgi:hypothetical protein